MIRPGAVGEWDDFSVAQPSVIERRGRFHMVYLGVGTGADGNPQTGIGYATSEDGFEWEKSSRNPILSSADLGLGAIHNPEIVFFDGEWWLYFSVNTTQDGSHSNPNGVSIRMARADSLDGDWEMNPQTILEVGADGNWDDHILQVGRVVAGDDQLMMVFSGNRGVYTGAVGYATSVDGVNWAVYDDATTTDAPYAFSDPVLATSTNAWDSGDVWAGTVSAYESGWLMLYHGGQQNPRNESLGLGFARSTDGVHWQRHPANPVLVLEGEYPQSPSMLVLDDNFALIYYSRRQLGSATSDIGMSFGGVPTFNE